MRAHQLAKQPFGERKFLLELVATVRHRKLLQRRPDFGPDAHRTGQEADRVEGAVGGGGDIEDRQRVFLELLQGQVHRLVLRFLGTDQRPERHETEMFV